MSDQYTLFRSWGNRGDVSFGTYEELLEKYTNTLKHNKDLVYISLTPQGYILQMSLKKIV
jgi:hypothetical protein